jgi:hypothetical protein
MAVLNLAYLSYQLQDMEEIMVVAAVSVVVVAPSS